MSKNKRLQRNGAVYDREESARILRPYTWPFLSAFVVLVLIQAYLNGFFYIPTGHVLVAGFPGVAVSMACGFALTKLGRYFGMSLRLDSQEAILISSIGSGVSALLFVPFSINLLLPLILR